MVLRGWFYENVVGGGGVIDGVINGRSRLR